MSEKYEPVILGFLCNWCAYAGGDLAGVSRLQYPPNMRPCGSCAPGWSTPTSCWRPSTAAPTACW